MNRRVWPTGWAIRTVFAQPDATAAREQWRRVADTFRARFPRVADLMNDAEADVLAYLTFPAAHWRHACSIDRRLGSDSIGSCRTGNSISVSSPASRPAVVA
jgi:hypothetical protein